MKNSFFLLIVVFLVSCEYAYRERGSGNMITEDLELSSFDEIELRGEYEVTLIESRSESIEIEADDNLMDDIEVEVIGNTLHVESRRIHSWKGIHLKIFYRNLEAINVGGAVDLTSRNPIRSKFFDVNIGGAGQIKLEFEGDKIEMKLSGAGNVELSGITRDLDVQMSGAGELNAFDLRSEYARVRISGVGGADIYVTKELDARISGLGDVTYRGNPSVIDKDVSGLGSIGQDRRYTDDE